MFRNGGYHISNSFSCYAGNEDISQAAAIAVKRAELKKLTRSDDEDETLDQIDMLIDFFEKRENPMTEFEETAFESIVEKIVVIDQHELEFHLIGGLKFKENV